MGSPIQTTLPPSAESEHVTPLDVRALVLADRCDACKAQAFARVINTLTGHDLLFCGHHYTKNEAHFTDPIWHVTDERHKINDKPSVSANAD